MNSSGMSRRALLAVSAGTLAAVTRSRSSAATGRSDTPFLWGAATAGHQVEGQNVNSDVWLLEHVKPTIYKESSGDACDGFNRWAEDLDLVKSLGLNCYRFSLEWARIEPVEGEFSMVMLDHYKRIVTGCRDRGLTPVVTFNHFTVPRWFAARGGWEVADAPNWFGRFCERAARHMANEIGYATTLNEPNLTRVLRWLPFPFPEAMVTAEREMLAEAARQSGSQKFSSANAGETEARLQPMIAGHKAGVAAIKSIEPSLPVGVSLAITDDQAVGDPGRRDQKRREVYGAWLQAAAESGDFIGVQNYSRQRLDQNGPMMPPKGAELSQLGEEVYPASLEGAIRYAHETTGKPVLVTENGICTTDDAQRAAFIPRAIEGVGRAMKSGVPVLGYIHWSLMDNFEWIFGYEPKYGLCAIEPGTLRRIPKPSARVYGAIAARGRP